MFKSSSESRLRAGFAAVLGALIVSAAPFYLAQNSGLLPGGQVAPVKLAWLACAILFWYLLPVLLLMDDRLPKLARLAITVLFVNMLCRAVIELFMMYVSGNWHPWLGIGHDIFSFVIMAAVTLAVLRKVSRPYGGYLCVATGMFVPEALFAWYMLMRASSSGDVVYFVGNEPAHRGIMLVTAVCVAVLLIYLISFVKQWLYAQTKR
jgi:hypothetical protein